MEDSHSSYNWCQACDTVRRPLLCAPCVEKHFIQSAYGHQYQVLLMHRSSLRSKLERLLEAKEMHRRQQIARKTVHDATRAAQDTAQSLEQRLAEVRKEVTELQVSNQKHRQESAQAKDNLAVANEDLAGFAQETLMRQAQQHDLTKHVNFEARQRLNALMDVLQFKVKSTEEIKSLKSFLSRVRPGQVSICGVPFSDILDPAAMGKGSQALRVASGLGYLLLFLDLAAYYLDSPIFHVLLFQSSTSRLFFPNKFGERYPSDTCGIDALIVPPVETEPSSTSAPPSTGGLLQWTYQKYSISKWTEQWEVFRVGGSAASAVVPRPCQAIESFLRSFSLSVEGFIADQLGPNIRSSPSGPHPLMLLAAMCLVDPTNNGRLGRAQCYGANAVRGNLQQSRVLGVASTLFLSVMDDEEWTEVPSARKAATSTRGMKESAASSDDDLRQWEEVGPRQVEWHHRKEKGKLHLLNPKNTFRVLNPRAAMAAAQRLTNTLSPGALAAAQTAVTAHILTPLRRTLGN